MNLLDLAMSPPSYATVVSRKDSVQRSSPVNVSVAHHNQNDIDLNNTDLSSSLTSSSATSAPHLGWFRRVATVLMPNASSNNDAATTPRQQRRHSTFDSQSPPSLSNAASPPSSPRSSPSSSPNSGILSSINSTSAPVAVPVPDSSKSQRLNRAYTAPPRPLTIHVGPSAGPMADNTTTTGQTFSPEELSPKMLVDTHHTIYYDYASMGAPALNAPPSRVYAHVTLCKPAPYWDYERTSLEAIRCRPARFVRSGNLVGSGRYSTVYDAVDTATNSRCVVKVIRPGKSKRIRREILILKNLQGGPHLIQFYGFQTDPETRQPSLVFAWLSNPNWRELYASFSPRDVKRYMWQLLRALDHTHSCGIMHRDVKPQNIMYEPKTGDLRLVDFGLAEFYFPHQRYSTRVASRFFKSPEILMGYSAYDYSLDVWSAGCVMAGLIFRIPVFFKGEDDVDQLSKIVQVLGTSSLTAYASNISTYLLLDPPTANSPTPPGAVMTPHDLATRLSLVAEASLSSGAAALSPTISHHPTFACAPVDFSAFLRGDGETEDAGPACCRGGYGDEMLVEGPLGKRGNKDYATPEAREVLKGLLTLDHWERWSCAEALANPWFDEVRDEMRRRGSV